MDPELNMYAALQAQASTRPPLQVRHVCGDLASVDPAAEDRDERRRLAVPGLQVWPRAAARPRPVRAGRHRLAGPGYPPCFVRYPNLVSDQVNDPF